MWSKTTSFNHLLDTANRRFFGRLSYMDFYPATACHGSVRLDSKILFSCDFLSVLISFEYGVVPLITSGRDAPFGTMFIFGAKIRVILERAWLRQIKWTWIRPNRIFSLIFRRLLNFEDFFFSVLKNIQLLEYYSFHLEKKRFLVAVWKMAAILHVARTMLRKLKVFGRGWKVW